jgi:hypothetical protein
MQWTCSIKEMPMAIWGPLLLPNRRGFLQVGSQSKEDYGILKRIKSFQIVVDEQDFTEHQHHQAFIILFPCHKYRDNWFFSIPKSVLYLLETFSALNIEWVSTSLRNSELQRIFRLSPLN